MTTRLSAGVRAVSFLLAALFALAFATSAQAANTPNIQLSGGPAASVLYGNDVPVDLTASLPAGAPKGYNLAYRVVLPAGVAYKAGSAGADGDPTVLVDKPTSGKTTLIWPNTDDLVANSSHTLSFKVTYNTTSSTATQKYDVGDLLPIDSGAYISTDPRDETDFDGAGQPVGPGAGTYTGKAEQTTNTSLTAIKIAKSEPHPEGEIPRGVHDHQTVYTLKVTNNDVNPTNAVSVEDYLPAGLEFLGCAGTLDHTTDAPTNPGSAQEYPGSGAITVAHPTAAEGCRAPDLVETISGDPDGAGPLPSGIYTHVKWNDIGDFPASGVKTLTYGAAIPIRENTLDWNGTADGNGSAPSTTGAQAVNLDNNSGPETYDEQPLLNGAIAKGTYQAPSKAGRAVSDEGTLLRTAEDIAIQKSNDKATLTQGDLTKWTIDVQVSEYRSVTNLVIRDTVPNGLCPLGVQNYTTGNSPSDGECAADAAHQPSSPYTSAVEQDNGTFAIAWDKQRAEDLGEIAPNGTRKITFFTRTRDHYQTSFQDGQPVRSNDSVENTIATEGQDWILKGSDGLPIWHTEDDGTLDFDVSGSGKSAVGPDILKQVAATYPGGDCGNLAAAHYGKVVPEYGPGDQVCWKLRLTFPQNLNTDSQDVFDILPAGLTYVPGTWQVTAANTVNVGAIDTSTAGRLRWPIGASGSDVQPGQVFEVTFKSTVGSPLGHHSGDVEGNLQKFSYENTAGTAFTLRDSADFALKIPELGLVKGLARINGTVIDDPATPADNVDGRQVQGGDVVQYRVDVTNHGTADAQDARVWDLLPAGIACSDVQPGTISDGGTCNTLSGRLEWTGIDLPKAATKTLTYKVKVPVGVSPDQTYVNTAGVVEYSYDTNDGGHYRLIPGNDVVKDPALPAANTAPAQDTSNVFTPASTIAKDRTTSVSETGNASANQATIGETVNYTVTTTIPKGTTLYGSPTVVDPLGNRQTLVPGSLCAAATPCTFDGAALPTAGIAVGESPANTITATFPAATFPAPSYAAPADHDVKLVLRFSAKVLDVDANTRGTSLPNTATLSFKDEQNRTITHSSTVTTTIVEPKAVVTKSHTPTGAVTSGQLVDFTVKAGATSGTNLSTAHDVTVVDTLPAGTEPVDGSGNAVADGAALGAQGGLWNATARTITWTPATTPALTAIVPGTDTVVNLTYKVRVESPAASGAEYLNTVTERIKSLDGTVGGVRTDGSTASTKGDYTSTATDKLKTALPAIAKTVSPDPVTIGNKVTWHVTVTLPKTLKYFDTTVIDTVPDGFDLDAGGTATCVSGCLPGDPAISTLGVTSGSAGTLQAAWYVGDLAASEADRVYDLVLKGHLRDTYRNGGAKVLNGQTLINGASVKTDRTDKVAGTPTSVPTTFDDTVGPATATSHVVEPKLTITKAVDKGPYVEGGTGLTYTVKVKNTGTSPAYDVVVTDKPDVELTNVQLQTGASYNTKAWSSADHTMKWIVPGPIAVGDTVTFTYTADVLPATSLHTGDTIVNTAAIGEYFGVPKTTRDTDGFVYRPYAGPDATVTLNVALPNLTIDKTPDDGNAVAGSPSSFTITVKNTDAHATAHNVTVHDVLDAGLSYTAHTATAVPAAGFSEVSPQSGQTIDWKVTSLAPGASVTITVPVGVDSGVANSAHLVNHASTRADDAPTEKSDDGSLNVAAKTDLAVTKTSPAGDVLAGGNVTYTITTTNNGPSDAKASTLADTLPSYLSFVLLDDTTNCSVTGQLVSCDYGTLKPGQTRVLHLTAKVDPARTAPIRNDVDVTTTTTETTTTNNHDHADNTIKPVADVSIVKTSDRPTYDGGDLVTYTLVAHNDGPSSAEHVTVEDDIPSDLTFVSASVPGGTCAESAGHVHCDLGTLAPGADRTVTIVTKAKGAPPANTPTTTHTHKITVGKEERYETLQAGETRTIDVTCSANGIASDGELQVVGVSAGSPTDVKVLQASSISPGTYRFVVRYDGTGQSQAQVRPHVTCLPHDTDADTNTHAIDVGPLKTLDTGSLPPGRYDFTIPVSAGHHAVAPGIELASGDARLVASEPSGNSWKFTVEVLQTAKATLSIRELSDTTAPAGSPSHVHAFSFVHVAQTFTVPAHQRANQLRVSCPVGYEGIVSTYDLPAGVVPLGSVPEPINRDFDVLNTTDHDIAVLLDLECISIQTGPPLDNVLPVVNTAHVATTTYDPDANNNVGSATITITRAAGSVDETPTPDTTPDAGPAPADPAPADPAPAAPAPADPAPAAPAPADPAPAAGPITSRLAAPSFGTVTVARTGSTASVPVTCSGRTACSGTVSLSVAVKAAKAKTRKVVLGTAKYTVKPGRTVRVTVRIAGAYRSLVKSGRVTSVSVTSGKTTATKKVVVAKRKASTGKR